MTAVRTIPSTSNAELTVAFGLALLGAHEREQKLPTLGTLATLKVTETKAMGDIFYIEAAVAGSDLVRSVGRDALERAIARYRETNPVVLAGRNPAAALGVTEQISVGDAGITARVRLRRPVGDHPSHEPARIAFDWARRGLARLELMGGWDRGRPGELDVQAISVSI